MKTQNITFTIVFGVITLLPAWANAETYLGNELLNLNNATFPDGQPIQAGTSLVLGPANIAKGLLLQFTYPSINAGFPQQATIAYNLTRLPCLVSFGCNGDGGPGVNDFDPIFYISDGKNAYGWQMADNKGGQFFAGAFNVADKSGGIWLDQSEKARKNGYPAIGQKAFIEIDYNVHEDRVDSEFRFAIDDVKGSSRVFNHSFSYFGGISNNAPIYFGIMNEDNPGERYQLDSVSIPAVPEPETGALFLAGLLLIGSISTFKHRNA